MSPNRHNRFRPFSIRRFASDGVREVLQRHGLDEIDAVFRAATSVRNRHRGRSIWSTELTERDGSRSRVYVKMNWGRTRLWPRLTDLSRGQWWQSLPLREWHGLGRLDALGISVPERLAVYQSGLLRFRAAVILREIPPDVSVFDMMQDGSWERLGPDEREQILEQMADRLNAIHAAGLGWRGASTVHVFPERIAGGAWNVWLIDCEGIHPRASARVRRRDVRKFVKSLWQSGADEATVATAERAIAGRQAQRASSAAPHTIGFAALRRGVRRPLGGG